MCCLGLSYFSFKEQASFKIHLIICDRVYLFIIFLVFILAVQTLHSPGQAFSNCGAFAPWHGGVLVSQPGIELASPVLEGGFLTTGPPGSCSGASFYQHSQQKYDFFIFVTI